MRVVAPHPAPGPGMTAAGIGAIQRTRDLVAQVRALRFLDALYGDTPAAPFAPADPGDPRYRMLRGLPGMGARPRGGQSTQIWLRDHRRCILFHTLIRSSAWVNGAPISLTVAELARLSGLSVQSILLALRDARATGEFTSVRAEADRRRLVLEPSAALRALADARRNAYARVASELTGRADPTPRLTPAAEQAWRRLYAELCVNKVGGAAARGSRLSLAARALLLWDLVTDGPQLLRLFIPVQQERRQASRQTILNHLAWLRAHGWLEPGDPLVPTALARARFSAMLGVFEACAHRVLDLLELLAEAPAVAGCVSLPPDDAISPRLWVRCRITAGVAATGRSGANRCAPPALCDVRGCPLQPGPADRPSVDADCRAA